MKEAAGFPLGTFELGPEVLHRIWGLIAGTYVTGESAISGMQAAWILFFWARENGA